MEKIQQKIKKKQSGETWHCYRAGEAAGSLCHRRLDLIVGDKQVMNFVIHVTLCGTLGRSLYGFELQYLC